MRKIIVLLFLLPLIAQSQGIYQPVTPTIYGSNNLRGNFSKTLTMPTYATAPSGTASLYSVLKTMGAFYYDSSAKKTWIFHPKDSSWSSLGGSTIAWDSITGKPSNFSTTYALSNDIQDSIQNRVPYENATRNLILGNYRMSARTVLNDSILARTSAGGKLLSNSGSLVAEWGVGGGDNMDFHGFAGMNYNRSGSMTSLSFTPKVYVDSLNALTVGTVTSVSAGIGMSFTTITSTGAVNADTTTLATRAYVAGLDVGKANTSLNNVNGVLSSTYGGAGSVSGILKANGSGVVSAVSAGDITSLISGTYVDLTTNQTVGGVKTFSSAVTGTSGINITGADATNSILYRYVGGTNNPGLFVSTTESTNTVNLSASGSVGGTILNLPSSVTVGGALSGTSLSMSGAGSFLGNVGVGTASPVYRLEVRPTNGAAVVDAAAFINLDGNNGSGAAIYIGTSQTSNYGNARIVGTSFSGNDYRSSLRLQTTTTAGVWNNGLLIDNTGASTFGSTVTTSNGSGTFFSAANTAGGFAKLEISSDATSTATLSYTNSLLVTGGAVTFAGALSGTSLSISGEGLFGGAVTNGVDKLRVAGSGLFSGNLTWGTTSGAYMKTVGGTTNFASTFTGSNYLYSGTTDFRINNQADNTTLLTILNTGAATFSSSVTALTGEFTAGVSVPNGTSSFTASANAILDVIGSRNSNSGSSAVSRVSIGNNASANGFTLKLFSSTHSTSPNVAQIYNEFNANLELGGYGATALTLGSGGAATFTGQINANSVGTNIRVKGDGGTGNDLLIYADGSGVFYFKNVLNTRGFLISSSNVFTHTGDASFSGQASAVGLVSTGNVTVNNTSTASLLLNNSTSGIQWSTSSNNSGLYVINNGAGSGITVGSSSNISAGSIILTSTMAAKGYVFNYASKSSSYTLAATDDYINVTSSCTITLPSASGLQGKRFVIKCVGSVTATIASTSSQTIDGNAASSYTFGGPNFNIMIVYSDGSNWFTEAWASGI